jgi:putative transposase
MPRNLRRTLSGVPLHVLQRGNDRAPCFRCNDDLVLYLGLLQELATRYECEVHAYVLMTNHLHLLVTPSNAGSVSGLMKGVSQRYAQHFNKVHDRTGTLWEGRFRSHIVDSETYLFACQRYIELNPVRAGMVSAPWEYPWSSYRTNAGLERSLVLTPHRTYLALGSTDDERVARYRAFFQHPPCRSELEAIRHCISTGSTLGCDAFVRDLELRMGRRGKSLPRGRPRGGSVPPGGKKSLTPV